MKNSANFNQTSQALAVATDGPTCWKEKEGNPTGGKEMIEG